MTVGTQVGKKLSVRSFMEQEETMELVLANKETPVFLGRFTGVARGVKPYKSTYGEGYSLIGEFKGTGADGEIKSGTSLFLPSYVQDTIVAVLAMENVEGVKIAYDVYAEYAAKSNTKYEYSVRNLLQIESPEMAEVEAEIAKLELPKLPAPAKK